MPGSDYFREKFVRFIIISLIFIFSQGVPVLAVNGMYDNPSSTVGYYMGEYVSDTIPSSIEAGSTYPITITYRNAGMVSWEWGVEKFGLLYQGLQSSIEVEPVFSQIPISIFPPLPFSL